MNLVFPQDVGPATMAVNGCLNGRLMTRNVARMYASVYLLLFFPHLRERLVAGNNRVFLDDVRTVVALAVGRGYTTFSFDAIVCIRRFDDS